MKPPEDNFLLKEEILHIVESLSVLSQSATLRLDANKYLPEKLAGDVQKFRLALQTVVEFAIKYCREGAIDLSVQFDGMTSEQMYLISFDMFFNRNTSYNDEPLIKLLNYIAKSPKVALRSALVHNYEGF
jgi:hypothetical protein